MIVRIAAFIGLEVLAVTAAFVHQVLGLHTDEAKYLLNIPYPHPPLLRWIMGLTDGWAFQEIFWRIVFATIVIQAVWLVWDMGCSLGLWKRFALCILWLFSVAVLSQAGAVFMAPITAVQALFLCWGPSRPDILKRWSPLIGFLWLEMLFTAYQGILFFPLVIAALHRSQMPRSRAMAVFLIPIFLLALYTITNPLAIESFGLAGGMSTELSFVDLFGRASKLWLMSGSIILSVLGVIGMMRGRDLALVSTFLILFAYVVVSFREYYAILFIPLFIAGILAFPKYLRHPVLLAGVHIVLGLLVAYFSSQTIDYSAQIVGAQLRDEGVSGTMLISGSFGHEWQYFLPGPVRRYRSEFLDEAAAAICREPCESFDTRTWRMILDGGEPVWVRQTP